MGKVPEPDLVNFMVLALGNCEFFPTFMNKDGNILVNLKSLRPDPIGYKKSPCKYYTTTPKDDCYNRDNIDVYLKQDDDNLDLDIIKEK